VDVDFENMALAQQLLSRQQGHAEAMKGHLEQYARLDSGDMGLILQLVLPINEAILTVGEGVLDLSAQAYGAAADTMGSTIDTYREADQTAYEAMVKVASELGIEFPGYSPSPTPTLGAAQQSASSRYADADGNVFNQAADDLYQVKEWLGSTASQAYDRIGDGLSSNRTVTEAVDVRSFLPAPAAEEPEIESIRWKAGIVLGSVDWLFEEIFGYSLLEEITKPFSGNWVRMREASIAWKHVGDALGGVAQNTSGLGPPMASWTGRGSEAFLLAAGVAAEAHMAVSSAPGTISSMLKALVFLSKKIAAKILKVLKDISYELMRIAVEAAVPVAGWVVAAAETVMMIQRIVDLVLTAYKWINIIYDFVSSMVRGKTQLVDVRFMLVDLAEGLARAGAARVA